MLSKGLKDKTTYNYHALAEEDAQVYTGRADVLEITNHLGVSAFKMKNTFKESTFDAYMSDTGEVLSTASIENSIATQLVADRKSAVTNTASFDKALQLLFGGVPAGTKNVLNKK